MDHPTKCARKKVIKRALVVDDDDFVRQILPRLLEEHQYDAEAAESPAKALAIIAQRRFDVVFIDYEMPGMNGIELARIVRENSPHSAVILMTGLAAAELFRSSRAHGFLQKPFSADALSEVLGKAVRKDGE
jgi:CheY-like chemotaxis protein